MNKSKFKILIFLLYLVLSVPLSYVLLKPLFSSYHIRKGSYFIEGLLWNKPVTMLNLRRGSVEFQKSVEYNYYQWEPHLRLGHTFLALAKSVKDKDKKEKFLEKCVSELITSNRFQIRPETYFYLAEAYKEMGRTDRTVLNFHLAYFFRDRPFHGQWEFRKKIREYWSQSVELAELYFKTNQFQRSILILKNLIEVQSDESKDRVSPELRMLIYALWDGVKENVPDSGITPEPDWGKVISKLDPELGFIGLTHLAQMGAREPVLRISPFFENLRIGSDLAVVRYWNSKTEFRQIIVNTF